MSSSAKPGTKLQELIISIGVKKGRQYQNQVDLLAQQIIVVSILKTQLERKMPTKQELSEALEILLESCWWYADQMVEQNPKLTKEEIAADVKKICLKSVQEG